MLRSTSWLNLEATGERIPFGLIRERSEEEWNKRVEKLRSLYESQRVSISDELASEEVTADFVGDMAYDEQTFDKYVESNKENTGLLASIARIFRSIANFFRNIGDKAHAKRLDNMTKKLDALIAASSEAVANGEVAEDRQGNPIYANGSLILEELSSIDDINDDDFIEPTRNIMLPALPSNVQEALGANGKRAIIKKNIFERNAIRHSDITPDQSREILKAALYSPDLYGQNQKSKKPYNWVVISVKSNDGANKLVLLEINNSKEYIEVIHWHYVDNRGIEKIKRQAEREDGQLLILPPDGSGEVGALSDPTLNMSSESKDTTSSPNMQEEGAKFSLREPIFYSNAEYAVRGIKQEKATPEQWLKMIEKNGGLKAGEDKWLGLSDWLKASDKKTLTKDEVLQYIAENDIQIEEVEYAQFGPELIDEATRKLEAEMREIGIDAMREKYNGFDDLFEVYNNELVWSENMASESEYEDFIIDNNIVDVNAQANAINETRSRYATNGLTNKREIALVVPTIEPYNAHDEVHFGDAGGGRAVAWVRFGETTDADGKRVLVIDEIQSKRHQDGREKGYISVEEKAAIDAIRAQREELSKKRRDWDYRTGEAWRQFQAGDITEREYNRLWDTQFDAEKKQLDEIEKSINTEVNVYDTFTKIPSAPFEKNWEELAMKRMLRYAAENGFDKVAWTTGDQQGERYNITKTISKIEKESKNRTECYVDLFESETGGVISFTVDKSSGEIIEQHRGSGFEGKNLSDVLGKSLAHEILSSRKRVFEQDNLRIGGEGMRAFYDQMLPSFVKKYTKKWGATVGEVTMPDLEENNTMHSVDVTPAMRESVMQGQPKFSLREVNDRFNEKLATLTEENARERILNVGTPSPILLACGIEDKPIRLYGAKLLSKVRKHGYKIDDLKNLPLAMNSPIAVFEGSRENSFAILTELRIGNNNVLAALSVGKGGHDVDFNIISSVYDKRENSVARWVNDGKMLWVDKKKALDYFSVSAPLAEAQNNQELISTTKVIQNFENPKIEARNSLITPEMDASNLDAVGRCVRRASRIGRLPTNKAHLKLLTTHRSKLIFFCIFTPTNNRFLRI